MRFLTWDDKKKMCDEGATRVRERFLLFPKEGRWLERAKWEEYYRYSSCCGICGGGDGFYWTFRKWLN